MPVLVAVVLAAAALLGCGKPFNVKPRTELPQANYNATASSDRVAIRAEQIADEDLLYEIFDANLILAGVLPVRVMLTNSTDQKVDLRKTRFDVRITQGRSFKAVSASQAFRRVVSYYEITTYNKSGYKESLNDFVGHALDTKTPLAARESREGLLFFPVPGELARETGLTLRVARLDTELIELKLS